MYDLAGFWHNVKKYKSGQIVDMQSKMYKRVNVTHWKPSTAIVGDDFEGDTLDVLLSKIIVWHLCAAKSGSSPRVTAAYRNIEKESLFQAVIFVSGSKNGKIKNFITK